MLTSPLYWILSFAGAIFFWLLPKQSRWGFLFFLSFVYLATLSPLGVITLLVWSVLFYYFSLRGNQNNAFNCALVGGILCQLLFFKCLPFSPSFSHFFSYSPIEIDIVVPIGLSYYTFKLIHYSIEVRRETLLKHNLFQFLCYIFFFPIYTAGPIEMFNHFLQHYEERWSLDSTVVGLSRISYGLIKKFILVDLLLDIQSIFGVESGTILTNLPAYSSIEIWALLLITYLTLYLDFSAYSDIAIGTARLFGLHIMENFNWPIFAQNIVDFWRRWHMTLAGWVQQYVFMPLIGLFRRPVLALFLSFIILGIWHQLSPSRIGWGIYHTIAIVLFIRWSRFRKRNLQQGEGLLPAKVGGILVTQIFLVSSMAFLVGDRDTNLLDCFRVLAKLICFDFPTS